MKPKSIDLSTSECLHSTGSNRNVSEDNKESVPTVTSILMQSSSANPYTRLFMGSLIKAGITVSPLSRRGVIAGGNQVVHIHWPEWMITDHRGVPRLHEGLKWAAVLVAAKVRGVALVWTVHNLKPHEPSRLAALFTRWLTSILDGVMSLSRAGLSGAVEQYPRLARLPAVVTPHGHYGPLHPDPPSRQAARVEIGLAPEVRHLIHFGGIRSYKGVAELLVSFRQLDEDRVSLSIVGRPKTRELDSEIKSLTQGDSRINLLLDHVSDRELERQICASDMVVLPYRDILHSGAAMMSLSLSRPVLAPTIGALPELRDEVGGDWLKLFEPPLTPAVLSDGLRWLDERPDEVDLDLSPWDWGKIAVATRDYYVKVRTRSRVPCERSL